MRKDRKGFLSKLLNSKASSLLIFVCGLSAQICTWPLLFAIGISFHKNELVQNILTIPMVLWFFVPLISIGAIVISVVQMRRKQASAITIVGLALNIIWLGLFMLLLYLLLVVGISA